MGIKRVIPNMARPAIMQNGRPVKLYLSEALIRTGTKIAFETNESLSGLVRKLLQGAVDRSAKSKKKAP